MSQLQQTVDITGQLSQTDLNSQDISNIIDELNRLLDTQNSGNTLTLYNDGQVNRYMIGYQTNGWGNNKNVGIKISQSGVDVTTASDTQLLYKNDFFTEYYYDNHGRNYMQTGLLPNGSYGSVQVATGQVKDLYP